jgi:hypothetical protein
MYKLLIILVTMLGFGFVASAQPEQDTVKRIDSTLYKITTSDKNEILGYIIKKDAREILIRTLENREFYIPQYSIKNIEQVDGTKLNSRGEYVGEDKFATRYFITTNGLPLKKGDNYIQWNLFGPDFQFGLADNFGIGVMTSWFGIPIIGTIKKSFQINENTHFALGGLVGTGSWALPDWGGALPFATFSKGDRSKNIAISGGYGAVWQPGNHGKSIVNGRALMSVAGMLKVSSKISLIFDSFIIFNSRVKEQYGNQLYEYNKPGLGLFIPGIRWHQEEGRAFQFGFTGVVTDGEFLPLPIPMVQWYRSF